jgi:DNA-binding beta-propeller fold protein YncE
MIRVYTADGEFVRGFGSLGTGEGQLIANGPIAFDPAGNLWMVVPEQARLAGFSPNGEPIGILDLSSVVKPFTFGLAIDAQGHFYVADFNMHRVAVFDAQGGYLFAWGENGSGLGQFVVPFSIALDGNGGVYVVDIDSPSRMQGFRLRE